MVSKEVLTLSEWLILYKLDHGCLLTSGVLRCWLEGPPRRRRRVFPEEVAYSSVLKLRRTRLVNLLPYQHSRYTPGLYEITEKGKEAYLENYV